MCTSCKRLLPLATTGDGNCLLHAASLGRSSNRETQVACFTFNPFFSSDENNFTWTRCGSGNSSVLNDVIKRVLNNSDLQKEPVSSMFGCYLRDLNTNLIIGRFAKNIFQGAGGLLSCTVCFSIIFVRHQ